MAHATSEMPAHPTEPVVTEHRVPPATVAAAGLVMLAVAMGIGRFAFTPILPMMQQDTGLTVPAGGWLAAANYFGYLLGAMSAMALRTRAAATVRTSLIAIAVVTLAMGLTHNFALWVALRLLAGMASAWVLVFGSAWCLESLAALGRPHWSGIMFAGVGSGITVAGLACLVLMQLQFDADHAWIALGVLALLLALAVWPVFGASHSPFRGPASAAPGALRWDGKSVRLTLCYTAAGFGYIVPATFLPAMAKQVIADPLVFGWSWPIFGVAAAAATLAAGTLQRYFSQRRLWMAAQLLMAAGVALPVVWSDIAAMLLAAIFVGGTLMVITMAAIQEGRAIGGRRATSLVAAMTTGFAIGQIAGPIVAGYAVTLGGSYTPALLSASALLIGATLLLPNYALSGRRPSER